MGTPPPGPPRPLRSSATRWTPWACAQSWSSTWPRSVARTATKATIEPSSSVAATMTALAQVRRPRSDRRTSALAQDVSHAAHGVQEARLAALLGLAPQVADVDGEGVRG